MGTPVSIPNTEVKSPIAEGTAGLACGRVGRCRIFFLEPQIFNEICGFFLCPEGAVAGSTGGAEELFLPLRGHGFA